MSLNLFWFLPTHGDGHYLGTEEGSRPVDHGYLQQIAQAADRIGFTGVLIPTGTLVRGCVAGSRIDDPRDPTPKFLVALRPSVVSPTSRRARRQRSTGSLTAGPCLTWSPEAIRRSWRVTACSSITPNAMSVRRVHPRLATSAGGGNRHLRR